MKELMDGDAERFRKAVEACGARISPTETVMTMTLRYEADLDLPTVAAELGLTPEELLARLRPSELLARNFGSLKVEGGTVARQVLIQAFGDMVRELRLGILFQSTQIGQNLPDNTGEIDPLEGQTSQANSMAFAPDGRYALFASADKTVRLIDIDGGRELRRFVGHTHSVWTVAFSPDGKRSALRQRRQHACACGTSRPAARCTSWRATRPGDERRVLAGRQAGADRAATIGTLLWWDLENLARRSATIRPR